MDVEAELRKVAQRYHLWDMGYTLEAIEEVLRMNWATDRERVDLAKAVLNTHFEHRAE